jgi:2-haloacid dehalogenase
MTNFDDFDVLIFDCYGTLIDWESGILSGIKPILFNHSIDLDDDQILELYAEIEVKIENEDYISYKKVLRNVVQEFGKKLNFKPISYEIDCLVETFDNWLPFPDTVDALRKLKTKFKLAILSNVDNDLFAITAKNLEVKFDYIITAEQVGNYKPSLENFKFAINKIGVSQDKIIHIAQSLYHDIIPAKELGLVTIWINRRKGKEGFGATPAASAKPDMEFPDLKSLVSTIFYSK